MSLSNFLKIALFTLPTLATATPATQEWVLEQIAKAEIASPGSQLVTADWDAVCSSGSPADATGCLGNASSLFFQKVSNGTGGFTTWANIQPHDAPESVYIKAFLAGTNTPVNPPTIGVFVPDGAARCGLFTTAGESIGIKGINNLNPTPGNALMQSATFGLIIALNMSEGGFTYEDATAPFIIKPQYPIYVMCVAYDPVDGATATSSAGSITAI